MAAARRSPPVRRSPRARRAHAVALAFQLAIASLVGAVMPAVAPLPVAAEEPPRDPGWSFFPEGGGVGVAAEPILPTGFREVTVFSGLSSPVALAFSPDGRVFVAEKAGTIKVFPSLTATGPPETFADLSSQVHSAHDRGLLGLAVDPGFATGRPYVYALYTANARIGDAAPRWPSSSCPDPPGLTRDGCDASGRLVRLEANLATNRMVGAEHVLVNDWCQQYPSHSMGALAFGPDGALYASAGNAASYTFADHGQGGGSPGSPVPANPCGDPPGGVGDLLTHPGAKGGAFRSQTLRRATGEPITLDGTIIRINPDTGAALPDNPLAGAADASARRIVAYGLRNPFRFAIRPGTNELWIGDPGDSGFEEINRVADPLAAAPVRNFGWPCYEANAQHPAYRSYTICAELYGDAAAPAAAPFFAYQHQVPLVPGDGCGTGSSVVSAIAFASGTAYPAPYRGALFFGDHARGCIWMMPPGPGGVPDPGAVRLFEHGAMAAVDLKAGPDGNLWYVDFLGTIRRIEYVSNAPQAVVHANVTSGPLPLTVHFDASASSDPDPGEALAYDWDLDGDGTFGDSSAVAPSRTYTSRARATVRLRVTDPHGLTDEAAIEISAGNSAPVPVIDSPNSGLTWATGDSIAFSGHATDPDDGALAATRLSWEILIGHCPASCHDHQLATFPGVASQSIAAPDHGTPSYLEFRLTAEDSEGLRATTSLRVDPQTVEITFETSPPGLSLVVNDQSASTPFTRALIPGSTASLQATSPQFGGGAASVFEAWSDGGAAVHNITVPGSSATLTATFRAVATIAVGDLDPALAANAWGPVEVDRSNGEQGAGDGGPIRIGGTTYARGLGVHAPSQVSYAIPLGCDRFVADVGIDDEVGAQGSAAFALLADGSAVAGSGVLTGAMGATRLEADLAGRTVLTLTVADGGDNSNYDHADWADARFLCPAGSGRASGLFAPPAGFPAGVHPHAVAAGDVNGDGRADLIVTNSSDSTIGVLPADGSGGFGPMAAFATGPAGARPKFSAIGDLDGDQDLDLVVADQDINSIAILRGDGTGGFAAPLLIGVCAAPHEVALGDVNGDTRLDAAVACWNGTTISVLLGDGNGTFGPAATLTSGGAPHSLVIADLDADGRADIAVANHDANTVGLLRGNGNGTFAPVVPLAVGSRPHAVRAGDLDGDGRLDLVTANDGADSVSVLLAAAGGGFTTAAAYPVGSVPKSVAIGDVNADGRLDVIASDTAGNGDGVTGRPRGDRVSVLIGNGDGTFQAARTERVGATPYSAVLAQLDGTGGLDIASADWDGGSVTVLRNVWGGGPPPPPVPDETRPTVLARTPPPNASGVSATVNPTATFSESLAPASVSASTFTLTRSGGAAVAAAVTWDVAARRATLVPGAPLVAGAVYTARLVGGAGGIRDLAGNTLAADVTWSFTVAQPPPPPPDGVAYLSALTPDSATNGWGPMEPDRSNGEQAGGDGGPLTVGGVVFSRGLGVHAPSEIRYVIPAGCTTFRASIGIDDEVGAQGSVIFRVLVDGTSVVERGPLGGAAAAVAIEADVTGRALLTLVVDADGGTEYDHADWADARLLCGDAPPDDTTPPAVTAFTPASGATGVATSVRPTITFSEAINPASLTSGSVFVAPNSGGPAVAASLGWDASAARVTLTPASALAASTRYRVTVRGGVAGVRDVAGNTLAADVTWLFRTGAATSPGGDTTAPTVTAISPADEATGVGRTPTITATFSEAMNPATLAAATYFVAPATGGAAVPATLAWKSGNRVATLVPTVKLARGTLYRVTVRGGATGVADVAGNRLASDRIWTFRVR